MRKQSVKLAQNFTILLILLIGGIGVQTFTSCSSGGDDNGGGTSSQSVGGNSSQSIGDISSSSDGGSSSSSSSQRGSDGSSSSNGGGGQNSSSSDTNNDYYRYYDPYSATAQRCQNGFVESKCGDGWYSPQTHACVSNQIKTTAEVYESLGYERCGSSWYNPASSRCQNGFVENKCGEEWYRAGIIDDNGIYYTCSNNAIVETRYERCGSSWYSPASYIRCQNGVLEGKCGDEWNNSTTQICHGETIDGTYSQTVIDKEKCGASNFVITYKCFVSKNTYNPETQFCYNGSQVLDKCGGSTYDPTSYFCYDNKRYSLCGDSKLEYNPETQGCSGSAVRLKCGTNLYNPETQFCSSIDTKVYSLCGDSKLEYNPETQRCSSGNIQQQCGTIWYNIETSFCLVDIVYPKCEGGTYTPSTQYCKNGILASYGSITDSRDGKKYNTTVIGGQTWIAENLNYNANGSVCYNNDPSNCTKYGRLYDWAAAMTACPSGWHLPSNAEWNTLMKIANPDCTINDRSCAGAGKLKASGGWNSYNIPASTDDFGFSALPGGVRDKDGTFSGSGNLGIWWSATETTVTGITFVYYQSMNYNSESVERNLVNKEDGYLFNVRCMMD
ncbi:hypothetical protein R83H12_01661 [Fibrobacteria bacterium R8-3-H12]